jgi:uncharacterized protein (TIGR00106 family)
MYAIIDLCVVPMGVGVSVSKYIAEIQKILNQSGLNFKMHAYGTNIEGEWDEVFAVVKKCHQVVHEMGAPRISSSLRIGTRVDRMQTMEDKIKSVENKLDF